MAAGEARRQTEEAVLVLLHWFLLATLLFLAYLSSSPDLLPRLFDVALVAVAHCAILTYSAVLRRHAPGLRTLTVILDVLIIAALVLLSGGNESPLLLFPLLPILIALLRSQWRGGLLAAFFVMLFWIYLDRISPGEGQTALGLIGKLVLLLGMVTFALLLSRVNSSSSRPGTGLTSSQTIAPVQAIWELTAVLSATLNYRRVLEAILDIGVMGLNEIRSRPDSPIGMVLLFADTASGRKLRVAMQRRLPAKEVEGFLAAERGLLGHVLRNVEPKVIHDPSHDEELKALPSLHPCRSLVAIPLRAGFELYGVLVLGSRLADAFGQDEITFLNALSNHAAIALQNAQLYQQLQDEKNRAIAAEGEVRRWLARELHDGPTQTLSAIAMRASLAQTLLDKEPGNIKNELANLEELANRATRQTRDILYRLRPLPLESQGLRGALEDFAERLQKSGGPSVRIDFDPAAEVLDMNTETAVFSIVEEAVNNACKHARADRIVVHVAKQGDLLVATVRDNGEGFDVAAVEHAYDKRGSLGLKNMQERTELLGGTLSLESHPDQGTTVTVTIPLTASG